MNIPEPQQPVFGGDIAGRMFDAVRQLQKNRKSYDPQQQPLGQNVAGGQEVMNVLMQQKQNEQK